MPCRVDAPSAAAAAITDEKPARTSGIVTSAPWSFETPRTTAECFADNVASWRLMEKLGMRREAHTVKDSLHRDKGWLDGFTYALLEDEWRTHHGRPSPDEGAGRPRDAASAGGQATEAAW